MYEKHATVCIVEPSEVFYFFDILFTRTYLLLQRLRHYKV